MVECVYIIYLIQQLVAKLQGYKGILLLNGVALDRRFWRRCCCRAAALLLLRCRSRLVSQFCLPSRLPCLQ